VTPHEVTLRDGSHVVIRPVEPFDREALAEGFSRLSPESRYRRFFSPISELSKRHLDYLTRVDHHDHEALVAVDPSTGQGVGVARYVRTGDGVAEPAMVVADDWQGRGVASRLLAELVRRAQAEGVRTFEAPVLAENRAAIETLARLGETSVRHEGREVVLHIDLAAPAAETEPRFRLLLREFGSGALQPGRALVDRLWPRRRGSAGDARRNLIVVGTDGSGHASAAVEAAAGLAAATGATVHVVSAQPFLLPGSDETAAAVSVAAQTMRERGVHVHEHVRRGDAALVLVDIADEERARLVVVGAGGRGGAARRLLGSVADRVAERAPCDVLIVRQR
jgi:nucleotide-binding universal stress UspA family protein/GNAT superfamily N-acetyltransferase